MDPNWEIGTVEVIKEEPDSPVCREEEEGLPEVSEELPYLMAYNMHEFIGRTTISAGHTEKKTNKKKNERYSLAYTFVWFWLSKNCGTRL